MSIVLDGTTGITTPEITSSGGPLVVNASAPDNSVVVNASGNVGIGTSSPSERLGVLSTLTGTTAGSNTVARLQTNGNGYDAHLAMGDNVNASTRIGYLSGAMYFWTNGAERARIDSSGNLLVGTTSQIQSGKVSVDSGTSAFTATISGGTGAGVGLDVQRTVANGDAAYFRSTTGLAGFISITGASTCTYNSVSDYRLKHDVEPMAGALAKVAALKPCTYKWNADDSDGEGFIAHELQEVCPSAVTGEKDAVDAEGNPQYQGIDTSFLVATLTAAIQELKAINDAQAQTITAQQAALESLTARVVALEGQP